MCFVWWMIENDIVLMDFLTELVDVLAENADVAKEKINWICDQGSLIDDGNHHISFSTTQIQAVLAIFRLLSRSQTYANLDELLECIIRFLRTIPLLSNETSFPRWFTRDVAKLYFTEMSSYLAKIAETNAAVSLTISDVIEATVTRYGVEEIPAMIRAFLSALSNADPPLDSSRIDQVSSSLLEKWVLPMQDKHCDIFLTDEDSYKKSVLSPSSQRSGQDRLEFFGKADNPVIEDESPISTPYSYHLAAKTSVLVNDDHGDHGHQSGQMNGNVPGRGSLDNMVLTSGLKDEAHNFQYFLELRDGNIQGLEKLGMALRFFIAILDKKGSGLVMNRNVLHQLRNTTVSQLKSMPAILKVRKRDWPCEAVILKPKMNIKLQVCKSASNLYCKTLPLLKLEGKILKVSLRETIAVLMDVTDSCTISPWRRLRACEDLFGCALQNVTLMASLCDSQDLKVLLLRLKTLVLATCAQADPWSSNQGPMFTSIVKATSEIALLGWNLDRPAVESFILSLAANVRDCNVQEEKEKQVMTTVQLNVIRFLADLVLSMQKPEVGEMICPLFVESLEEGHASSPSRLRLQLLNSLALIATLGFEKSYRETVVLLTRGYIDKLSTVGSTQSRTLAPEATTERVETLPGAFLSIASGLSQPKLRADYRQRLLQLCSDVGLVAESKSGKNGADLLGPLLPAVAEICSDFNFTGMVEPTILKLFRNLWFYIVLFGLAPPIQKVQSVPKNVSSSIPSLGSMSAVALQAVAGPYLWNTQWSAAVIRITQGTPPLVVSSLKWVEDERELNELHNPGSRRGSNNDKATSAQRAALCAALKDHIDMASVSTMSGVKATYFLAVAFLEILRLRCNGGVFKSLSAEEKPRSSLSCAFEYLEKPNLAPSVYQCLIAIVHRAFDAAMTWLDERHGGKGVGSEDKDMAIVTHACFLISKMAHRDENVCDLACRFLKQVKLKYPQILWNISCLDGLLHLVRAEPPASIDAARLASMKSLIKQQIRNWVIQSLSMAPCTTQGLLQERIRSLNSWSNGSYTSDLLPLLSDIKLDTMSSQMPAVFAAAVAAAGARGHLAKSGSLEVLSNGIVSANVKSSYIHINIGGMIYGQVQFQESLSVTPSGDLNGKTNGLKERLIKTFIQMLQQFMSSVEQGKVIDTEAFRETCLRSTAFIVSELEVSKNVEIERMFPLIRLLCWCPAYICSPESLSTGVFIWTWLVSAAPHLSCLVLAELVDAWLWTIETNRGLFASAPAYSGPAGKLRPHLTPGEPISEDKDPVEGIIAHRIWLGFFFDRFEVVRHNSPEQLSLIGRLLQGSLKRPAQFSSHPVATGTFFSLMLLGLKYCSCQIKANGGINASILLLEDHIYRTSLAWFSAEPQWYDCNLEGFSQEEAYTVAIFAQYLCMDRSDFAHIEALGKPAIQEIESLAGINICSQFDNSHPVWGKGENHLIWRERRKQLLIMLCQHEADRLDTWANPLRETSAGRSRFSSDRWIEFVQTAWSVDPRIAIALPRRFPTVGSLRTEVMSLVQENIPEMYNVPEALPYVITPKAAEESSPVLQLLPHWAPCSITGALEFLTPSFRGHPRIMAYVLRVLETYPSESVTFFMPQLVQALRYDDGLVEQYLINAAQRSHIFAHILIWQLQGEEPPSTEEFTKEQLQDENAFHSIVLKVKDKIIKSFNPEALDMYEREFRFFDNVTSISGVLYPVPKEKRRDSIKRELENIKVEGDDLYLPTAPNKLVRGIQLDSGIPLQSAAKVPIMVTFDVVDKDEPHLRSSQPCIFKVGDDCRQDVLALQVIGLLRDIFKAVGLNLYLFPYGVLPTGCGKGIVEVVPNTRSRNQMGETTDGGLYEIFQQDYGPVGSPKFEKARDNFIVSSAGYAVASLLLQPKDRHNGNLLFDNEGRLVHIDFGFILETSPGGNMRFENAQFKLSHEMTQLLDPSGVMKSETWNRFVSLCVKGYLAARLHMDGIINTVLLMIDSGLPCFSRGDPIGNLRRRFHPEMSDREAANFMIKTCADAYNKWTTAGYDLIQYLQQGIEK